MFLAINELIKEKSRFILITVVIVLVSYLAFFLTALAYGLATSYTQGLDSWEADGIVLQKDANKVIGRSLLFESDYKDHLGDNVALLGVGSATVEEDQPDDVSIFGIDWQGFLAPAISEGRAVKANDEVVVDSELADIGVKIGGDISFKGSETKYKVVGFVKKATFQTAPIVYVTLDAWRDAVSDIAGMSSMKDASTVSALVAKSGDTSEFNTDRMEWLSIRDFSFSLPGYQAQVLTFSLMISFLIGIAAFVLAIFMYILTIQKKSIFGVLKAEGVPGSYIASSVMIQGVVLSLTGVAIGMGLALISGYFLAGKVPFSVNVLFYSGITALFLVFAVIGGLASVRSVAKIDPVEAIE